LIRCAGPVSVPRERRFWERMLAHPHAPVYRNQSGHRLQADELQAALAYEQQVARYQPGDADIPDWLPDFVRDVCQKVPAYKALAGLPFSGAPDLDTRGSVAIDRALCAG
jgi:phenylacetate-CoA ligase